MNNINWGLLDETADIMTPGEIAGVGRCEAGQWGVIVNTVVVYSSLAGLRSWAQSILDQLPPDRDGAPLVTVDGDQLRAWLDTSEAATDPDWTATAETVHDLVQAIADDPAAAGWTLGDDVDELWADLDDDGDLIAGVKLASTDQQVGMGAPLHTDDLAAPSVDLPGPVELAHSCLALVADRINKAY